MLEFARPPRLALIMATSVSAVLFSTPLLAENRSDMPNPVVVQTKDLDLTSNDGRRRLDRRLNHAAFLICSNSTPQSTFPFSCEREILIGVEARRDAVIAAQQERRVDAELAEVQ